MRELLNALTVASMLAAASAAHSAVTLYDVATQGAAWTTATTGLTATQAYNFNADADYDVQGFQGPLTSAGAGPVSAGNLAPGVVMDRVKSGGGRDGLAAVGPSAGLGNSQNAVVANFFVDGFSVLSFGGGIAAFEFNALTILGGSMLDISVFDSAANQYDFLGVNVDGAAGRVLGFVASGGMDIASIQFFDASGGVEGLQGAGTIYYSNNVPEPGTMVLVGLALVGVGVARRRKA